MGRVSEGVGSEIAPRMQRVRTCPCETATVRAQTSRRCKGAVGTLPSVPPKMKIRVDGLCSVALCPWRAVGERPYTCRLSHCAMARGQLQRPAGCLSMHVAVKFLLVA